MVETGPYHNKHKSHKIYTLPLKALKNQTNTKWILPCRCHQSCLRYVRSKYWTSRIAPCVWSQSFVWLSWLSFWLPQSPLWLIGIFPLLHPVWEGQIDGKCIMNYDPKFILEINKRLLLFICIAQLLWRASSLYRFS